MVSTDNGAFGESRRKKSSAQAGVATPEHSVPPSEAGNDNTERKKQNWQKNFETAGVAEDFDASEEKGSNAPKQKSEIINHSGIFGRGSLKK